ncbi:MAG: hypothetical protein BRC37_04390 [Cyanobacteria bacterium QH_3_48_40]|nr:MAG: hypothetical protein BRC37_04390 [Cyanobacteria bacterium QH_3_48_40]
MQLSKSPLEEYLKPEIAIQLRNSCQSKTQPRGSDWAPIKLELLLSTQARLNQIKQPIRPD